MATAILSPSLRARRAVRTFSFFFCRNSFLYSNSFCTLCLLPNNYYFFIIIFFVFVFSFSFLFLSFFFIYSFLFDGVMQKLFVCLENSILFFSSRGYFTITSRVRHAHIDVVVITNSSLFVMVVFSLAFKICIYNNSDRAEQSVEHEHKCQ